ncbi:MAG: hypothetical protein IJB86_06600 [Clostridia bacterium]|nr:hypothetical protein [Clostridia bacterium]
MNKKFFKRVLSVLLVATLILGTMSATIASAADAKTRIFLRCYDNNDLECTVLIMSFEIYEYNQKYTQIGEKPEVTLTIGEEVQTISEDKILQQINSRDAQLFICLPTYLSDEKENAIPTTAMLTVSEAAFIDKNGKSSPGYSGQLEALTGISNSTLDWERVADVVGAEADVPSAYRFSEDKNKVVLGTQVELVSNCFAFEVEDFTFYKDGEPLNENVIIPEECGTYTYFGKVNDFIYDTVTFTVVTKEEARKDTLAILGKINLQALYMVPLGLISVLFGGLFGGWGFIFGSFTLDAQFSYISWFYKQLFSKELLDKYYPITMK